MFVAWGVLALLTLVHLAAHLLGAETLADASQWFLMPVLAGCLWLATRRHTADDPGRRSQLVRLTLVALGFSWLGDTAPDLADGDTAFLVMVGFFLCAQVVYTIAFWPYRAGSVLRRPLALVPYGLALLALVVACAPDAGSLLVPVVVYGVCLVTMAVVATGVDRLAAVGGAVFLLSDALIALNAFAPWYDLPGHGFWVMLTYVVGQVLLVLGVLRRERGLPVVDAEGDRARVST
ncbi:lysoplasmalogenase [Cellulosimicrobium funkei]|uniref:Lysoplasmalogenase n=1 Tax=Cellulosimicrobium funkei TaxID=264251 RepID=A0A4Y8R5G5_9MICO|nr:lysoplasmalogenase [Cellulosimicrobium funkei]TFF16842.1 lysoplasmalogenase [Cellulosimicrobium funkei]TGA78328.1 lysoplasmalogenase [Cellulosimicrobium terreum]